MTLVPRHGFPVGVPGYQSLGLLGQGASGQVFKARQRSTGQFVAIKIPNAPSTHDPAARRHVQQRLHHETRLLAMLQHTHVVRLIDKGLASGGLVFAALEFVPGETLRDFLQHNGRISLLDTLTLMAQLLDALAFLHMNQIVHRDLKPENVMVIPTGTALHAKVLDLGLASHHGEPSFIAGAAGTPAYCAPEQLLGEHCVPATDIYAWALIFVECLNAKPCVQGANVDEVLQRQLSPAAIALPEALLGQPLTALLRRALHKDVRQRAADAAYLHGELIHCLAHLRNVDPDTPASMPAMSRLAAARQMTVDPVHAWSSRGHKMLSRTILCLTLRLYPTDDASVTLSDLREMREQQMDWCANAIREGQGHGAGILGDSMLFHFDEGSSRTHHQQQAAALALDLCARVGRRSRVLEVQRGVRLDVSGALHITTLASPSDVSSGNHATNVALHLNGLAAPGIVVISNEMRDELAGSLPMEAYANTRHEHAKPVYRLVAMPSS